MAQSSKTPNYTLAAQNARFVRASKFRSNENATLYVVAVSEPLSYMREHDFSQVIVLHDGRYSVLSTEGVAHWLEAKSKEDIIALSEVRLSDVLTFEPKDSCIYLKVNETVDRARQIFVNDIGKRIFSALITEHGIAKEKPVNIIT